MSRFCAVIKCKNRSGHKFPKDVKQRREWIAAVNRKNWKPSAFCFICYDHFKNDDFKEKTTGDPTAVRRLIKGVVPSIFMHKCKEEKAPVKKRSRSHFCCICNRNSEDHRHLTFHKFPLRGKTFISVKDDASDVVVKKDRLTLWIEFAKIPEAFTARHVCSLHFQHDDYKCPGYNRKRQYLKTTAVPSIYDVDDTEPLAEDNTASQLPPHHQDQDAEDEMQIDTLDDVIRPPDMLCAIYSLPDANPVELDAQDAVSSAQSCTNNSQILDTTDDMDSFYSRCLLCTCRPDATPHIEIFSEAGNQIKLAEKINKCLNIQIETDLPQRVCQSCLEKLEVTHELVTVCQQARILLLQIKQQCKNLETEVTFMDQDNLDKSCAEKTCEHVDIQQTHIQIKEEQDSTDSHCSVIDTELDPLEPTIDSADENSINVPTGEDESDSNSSAVDFDETSNDPVFHSSEEPTCDTVCETTSKPDTLPKKPEVHQPTEETEKDGPSEEDFVKCSQCTHVIYKGYMAFHVKTYHGEMTPVVPKIVDATVQKKRQQSQRFLILDLRMCTICKTRLYSQVMDLHMILRHTEPSADNGETTEELPVTDLSRLMHCPACPCMFFPDSMQSHIMEEHPPTPNPELQRPMMCIYCHRKATYHEMSEHLTLKHGSNAWTQCIHCKKKVMNTEADMEAHLFLDHPGGNFLACKICDRRYSLTGKKQAHMQTYLRCKYKCPFKSCREMFVTLSSFKDHVLSSHPKIEYIMHDEIKKETEDILNNKIPVVDSACMNLVENTDADEELESKDENSENNKINGSSETKEMNESSEIVKNPVNMEVVQDPNRIEIQEIPLPPKFIPFATKEKHDYGGPVDCDICREKVKHKWCLIQHKNKVHDLNLRYNCEDCGTNYKHLSGILNHIHLSHLPKDRACEQCGESFTKRRYTLHLLWHKKFPNGVEPRNLLDRPLDPVRCGMCNRPARNKYALLTHINADHLDVVKERLTFHCEQCDKEFANYEYLMHHHYSMHLPKIVCIYCGKLINQNRMSMHLRIHEPDRGPNYKGNKRGRKRKRALN